MRDWRMCCSAPRTGEGEGNELAGLDVGACGVSGGPAQGPHTEMALHNGVGGHSLKQVLLHGGGMQRCEAAAMLSVRAALARRT